MPRVSGWNDLCPAPMTGLIGGQGQGISWADHNAQKSNKRKALAHKIALEVLEDMTNYEVGSTGWLVEVKTLIKDHCSREYIADRLETAKAIEAITSVEVADKEYRRGYFGR